MVTSKTPRSSTRAVKSIYSRAPTRMDLAGGTIDIWPLYLFLEHPTTINMAIDLYAEATVDLSEPASGASSAEVCLKSLDQNVELRFPWRAIDLNSPTPPPALEIHYKLLRHFYQGLVLKDAFAANQNLTLSTRSQSPAGAGLGGSSSLSIAVIGALGTWAAAVEGKRAVDPTLDGEKFIQIVRDVETTVIQVPAGLQDYYGAMYGGLQKLQWGYGSHQRESLETSLIEEIEKRTLLFYSGQSRNSGINNWSLFKKFIDKQDDVRSKFESISAATESLGTALKTGNWQDVGLAIAQEWKTRKSLAPGISTPDMDEVFAAAAKLGPFSGKVCGAGGGGCFFVYFPERDSTLQERLMEKVENSFSAKGIRRLQFRGAPTGLEIRVERA